MCLYLLYMFASLTCYSLYYIWNAILSSTMWLTISRRHTHECRKILLCKCHQYFLFWLPL